MLIAIGSTAQWIAQATDATAPTLSSSSPRFIGLTWSLVLVSVGSAVPARRRRASCPAGGRIRGAAALALPRALLLQHVSEPLGRVAVHAPLPAARGAGLVERRRERLADERRLVG